MTRSLPRLAPYFVALLLLPLLAACGAQQGANAPTAATTNDPAATAAPAADAGETIRLGYVPAIIYAPLFVAQERGYFRDEGLNVELTPLQGGSDSVVQLAAGSFDAAIGGAGAGLFNAAARGVEFTIVAPMHQERPPIPSPLVISAARADEIKTVADLRGKKVSINATGAATEYWLGQALERAGLTFNDIELSAVAFRDVPAAIESGSLDAAILGEPLVTINEDSGLITVLADDFIDGFTSTFLYMGEPLLNERPEAARGFLRAYIRACRDLQGDYMTPEIARIVEKYTQVPAAVVERAALAQYEPNGRIPVEDINTLQGYFRERGLLEYDQPLDVTAFIDQSLADDVVQELGAR
jgi:NitT/TauT family transport system substrate-binding protein